MSGEVPEGWRVGRFGEFLKAAHGGGTPPRDNPAYWGRDLPWASVKDVTSGAREPLEWITAEGLKNSTSRRVAAGTNILAMRMAVGSVIRYGRDVAINQDLVALIPAESLDGDFLFHWLRHHSSRFADVATGTTVKGLRKDILLDWPISLPPLDEQRRIAEVLQSMDEVVGALHASLGAAASVRQATLDEVMRREASSAEHLPLDAVAEVRTGLAKNAGRRGQKLSLPYLRVANVQDGWIDLTEVKTVDIDASAVSRYSLQPGDVLLTEGGDFDKLGRGGVWNGEIEPCLHQNHVFAVRPDRTRLASAFLALLTQSYLGRTYFRSCAKRTTNLASINSSQLKKLPVPLPSLARQNEIASEIASLDRFIAIEKGRRAALRRSKNALLHDLLSGRVRVPA